MTKPVFLLGVGCQKGGTTWLHDYLFKNPEVRLGLPKEMHIFNTMLRPDLNMQFYFRALLNHEKPRSRVRRLRNKINRWRKKGHLAATPMERIAMMNDPQVYVSYFKNIADRKVTGEITPNYAILNGEEFSYVRSILEPHFHVKVIFLMRDPVERTRSAVRMMLRPDFSQVGRHLFTSEPELFRRMFNRSNYLEQSLFNRTIDALEEAFEPEDIYYGFFETLFNDESLQNICDFLGVPFIPGNFGRAMNTTKKTDNFDPVLIARAREAYDPAYKFCAERFGEAFIAEHWQHYR